MVSSSIFKSLKSTSLFILPLLLLLLSLEINAHGGHVSDDNNSPYSGDSKKLHSKHLILVKIWCLLIFFFSTFSFGVSPYFLRWHEGFLVLGTQFAAGIFLGTSLMHFLSDSTSTFNDLTSIEYPFSFMLACVGYLVTMFGDCVVVYVARRSAGNNTRVTVEEGRKEDDEANRGGEVGGDEAVRHSPIFIKTSSMGDTLLLIFALCFHSIFEGIAVGIADTEADAWRNMWTITLHKVFAAVAMGIALLRLLPKRPLFATVMYSFAFAISSPIGVAIGIAIDATTQGRAADWTYAIAMGFATGIFIYVAINHLIGKGYKAESPCYFDSPFYRFSAVFLGVAVMAVVMIWD